MGEAHQEDVQSQSDSNISSKPTIEGLGRAGWSLAMSVGVFVGVDVGVADGVLDGVEDAVMVGVVDGLDDGVEEGVHVADGRAKGCAWVRP